MRKSLQQLPVNTRTVYCWILVASASTNGVGLGAGLVGRPTNGASVQETCSETLITRFSFKGKRETIIARVRITDEKCV